MSLLQMFLKYKLLITERIIIYYAANSVSSLRIKLRSLKAMRINDGLFASTSYCFLFCRCKQLCTITLFAPALMHPEDKNAQGTSPRKSGQACNNLCIGITDKNS